MLSSAARARCRSCYRVDRHSLPFDEEWHVIADRSVRVMLGLCMVVVILAALYVARPLFAPIAFALFIIALVWPLQRALQERIPTLVALAATVSVTAIVIAVVVFLVVWGFGVVGQWLYGNVTRFQEL